MSTRIDETPFHNNRDISSFNHFDKLVISYCIVILQYANKHMIRITVFVYESAVVLYNAFIRLNRISTG